MSIIFYIKEKEVITIYYFTLIPHERAGIRTPDNLIKSQVLYHLSYTPLFNYFLCKENAQNRNRTSDTRIFSPLLYRLSYLGKCTFSCASCGGRI